MHKLISATALSALIATAPLQAQFREDNGDYRTTQAQSSQSSSSGGLLGGVFNCSAQGNKQTTGAILGGVAGAFLGNRIAGRGSRTLGTVIGGALGAAAGSAVGCKLQKNDRAKAEAAAERALATGESQSWRNDETGAYGRFDVADSGTGGSTLGNLRFSDGVEPASNYSRVADSYVLRSNAYVRSGPSTSTRPMGTLPAGQTVWVPAQVSGEPWMLIAENGTAMGYIHSSLLDRTTRVASSNCKMVTQRVSVPGENEQSETFQACKDANGSWTMTKV